jgi:prevent-host-death family protein
VERFADILRAVEDGETVTITRHNKPIATVSPSKPAEKPVPKLKTSQAVQDMLITVIPFAPRHAYRLYSLPVHHGDPFDRMIISTALVENMPIVGDRQFTSYKGLTVIWR